MRENPFCLYDRFLEPIGWAWYDETGCEHPVIYRSEGDATRALLDYINYLEHGPHPPLWQRILWQLERLWRDEGTLPRR